MGDSAFRDLERVRRSGRRALLVTVVRAVGSVYRPPGASMVVTEDGELIGAVSGGCLDAEILEAARSLFAGSPPRLLEYDTSGPEDIVWGTGSGCGGRITLLIGPLPDDLLAQVLERLRQGEPAVLETVIGPGLLLGQRRWHGAAGPDEGQAPFWYTEGGNRFHQYIPVPITLLLCGAGNDAQPVAALAAAAGFRVIVADPRPAWLTPERFPTAAELCPLDPADLPPLPPGSYAVLMTHNYLKDVEWLKSLLVQPMAYIGLLGARQRSRQLLAQLLAEQPDLAEPARACLRAPVGLDIGADGPMEIGLAVVAEMVAHRAGASGLPLAEVRGSLVPERACAD